MSALETIEEKIDAIMERVSAGGARWLTVEGAAAHSGLSDAVVRRFLAGGKLTAHRPVPGRILIDRRQLDALILSSTGRPSVGRGRHGRRPTATAGV